jgi:hypothetical protein
MKVWSIGYCGMIMPVSCVNCAAPARYFTFASRTVVGQSRCSVVDTYWQTETGGHMLTPLPGATPAKPGSAVRFQSC